MNDEAFNLASEHLEQARDLVKKIFYCNSPSDKPDITEVLMCAQLLATEYNSLVVEKSAVVVAENLKSYLHNEF